MQVTATYKNRIDSVNNHNITKRSIYNDRSYFFKKPKFFWIRHNDNNPKPEFISTIDIFKLLDKDYAMQEFYCVINKGPCDSVGLRLKGI